MKKRAQEFHRRFVLPPADKAADNAKNPGEVLNKLKSKSFLASSLSTYDLSTPYTTLPHNLIKKQTNEIN